MNKKAIFSSLLLASPSILLAEGESASNDNTTDSNNNNTTEATTTEQPPPFNMFGPGMQMGRRFNSIVSMAYNTVTTNHGRNDFEARIKRYGCHCFPGSSKSGTTDRHTAVGAGPAVDDIDNVCRRLARCHKCIDLMYPGEIDVNDGRYSWDFDQSSKKFDCSKNKNNKARHALCECDASFAVELGKVWSDSTWNTNFWLNNRNNRQMDDAFDYDGTCIRTKPKSNNSNNLQIADKCCGVGFEPYNSGTKNCCEASGKVYDPNLHECCEDGSVKTFGGC